MSTGKINAPCCGADSACCPPASRYPIPAPIKISANMWKKPAAPASPQFNQECYPDSKCCPDSKNDPFIYTGANLAAIDFPVGGFGAGNVKIAGDGTLDKFTIINQPAETTTFMPNNFFGISTAPTNDPTQAQSFVLQSPETYNQQNCNLPSDAPAHVPPGAIQRLQHLPGIQSITLKGTYPIADLKYNIVNFPLDVSMEAMSPCIPQDIKNSSLPCGLFTFTITNSSTTSRNVRLLQSQQNIIGWDGHSDCSHGTNANWGGNVNTPVDTSTYVTMSMSNATHNNGTMSLSSMKTKHVVTTVIPSATSSTDIWTQFCQKKDLPATSASPSKPSAATHSTCCGLVQSLTLAPNATATVTFLLTWHFPFRMRDALGLKQWNGILPDELGNRYADWFKNSQDVASYVTTHLNELLTITRTYTNTMYASTLPPELLDSAAGRVACMRSATMWWTNVACSLKYGQNGCVMGTEGNGCCPLNCTHVYGYTTLMERLYPSLAKDRRISDYIRNFDIKHGGNIMRFGRGGWAIDGALANIIKTYLVVRQSDPTLEFLTIVWKNVKAQFQYIQENFDVDGDAVIRKPQQNTYDTAMNGANTFIGSYYVTALKAMAAMSTLMKEDDAAAKFTATAIKSAANYEKICWNDDFGYYIADVTLKNCQHSYGPGCFVDQLCCIGLSSACGFGHIFNPKHEAIARKSLLKNNVVIKPPFQDMQKHFYNGDVGVTACTYPNGKLGAGMTYETIVSTGFTSPNIAGMLLDRNVVDACTLAQYIRTRHDGRTASPWNEPECNQLYSRAMAHFNIFDQACGFKYDSTQKSFFFDPRMNQTNFRCFISLHGGWGNFSQNGVAGRLPPALKDETKEEKNDIITLASGHADLQCLWGTMVIRSVGLMTTATSVIATLNGTAVAVASFDKGVVMLSKDVTLKLNDILSIVLTGGEEKSHIWMNVGSDRTSNIDQQTTYAHGHEHGHGGYVQVRHIPTAPVSCGGSCEPSPDCHQGCATMNKDPSVDDYKGDAQQIESTPRGSFTGMQMILIFLCGMLVAWLLQYIFALL